jgi:predicted RNA-binding Zn-ribbon protein involved in translation (DUF1610 family)
MSPAPDEQYCASCGEAIKEQAVRCPECGVANDGSARKKGGQTVFCQSCGEQISTDAEMCPGCGVRQDTSVGPPFQSDTAELLYYGQIIIGAILVLAGLRAITDGAGNIVLSLLVGLALAGGGLLLIPHIRERIDMEHPITTFGWTRSVSESPVSNTSQQCTSCGGDIESGTRREYGSDLVVAGVVLTSRVEGENQYCESCMAVERSIDMAESTMDTETEQAGR